jgi:hypothetical protein
MRRQRVKNALFAAALRVTARKTGAMHRTHGIYAITAYLNEKLKRPTRLSAVGGAADPAAEEVHCMTTIDNPPSRLLPPREHAQRAKAGPVRSAGQPHAADPEPRWRIGELNAVAGEVERLFAQCRLESRAVTTLRAPAMSGTPSIGERPTRGGRWSILIPADQTWPATTCGPCAGMSKSCAPPSRAHPLHSTCSAPAS